MQTAGRISRSRTLVLVLLLGAGVAVSLLLSTSLARQAQTQRKAQAEQAASQLTSSFMLLLDIANGPLRSLATLFNGSGRVSAKEFADTIEFIRKQGSPMPGGMGFLVRSTASSCEVATDCWVVAYSTTQEGLLQPGADVSRFGPTRATIAAAVAAEDTLTTGPAFRLASGDQSSFCAVTIRNTRQYGVLVSRVDYAALIEQLYDGWGIQGLVLRLAAAFPDGEAMTDYTFIHGGPDPAPETLETIVVAASSAGAQFRLTWDMLPDFGGTRPALSARGALVGGITVSVLVTALLGAWLARAPSRSG